MWRYDVRILLFTLYLVSTSAASAQITQSAKANDSVYDCSKPPTACDKPVKWLTDKDDCSCFACEYGKAGRQHTVCTSNMDSKVALRRLSLSNHNELASGPVKTFSGTVVSEDGVVALVDDDGKRWTIQNPDVVQKRMGKTSKLRAHVNEKKGEILVMTESKASEHKE
jgi:hypothetical protein